MNVSTKLPPNFFVMLNVFIYTLLSFHDFYYFLYDFQIPYELKVGYSRFLEMVVFSVTFELVYH